jgi:hypothetical protein
MTATPAQVANDLTAQAVYFARRDAHVERACRDAARMIRRHLLGEPVDGRSWGGLHRRLLDLTHRYRGTAIGGSMERGLDTLFQLRARP